MGGCLSSSILFKYESSMGHVFILSWARYVGLLLGVLFWSGMVFVTVLSVVEICADYGGVIVFHVCLDFVVVGFVPMAVL